MRARPDALEARVLARKAELTAEIIEHMKNSSRFGAADAIARIKVRLADLAQIVKAGVVVKGGVVDDWANLRPEAKRQFDEWLMR